MFICFVIECYWCHLDNPLQIIKCVRLHLDSLVPFLNLRQKTCKCEDLFPHCLLSGDYKMCGIKVKTRVIKHILPVRAKVQTNQTQETKQESNLSENTQKS